MNTISEVLCQRKEDHRLYTALQIICPCFRDGGEPFTQKEVDKLSEALLALPRDNAAAVLAHLAMSVDMADAYKKLMLELGRRRDLYEHVLGSI